MPKVIGFCGYARVGKDTSAEAVSKGMNHFKFDIMGYADELKNDLNGCAAWAEKHGIDIKSEKFKETIRPMYVLWSRVAKDLAEDDTIWLRRLDRTIDICHKLDIIPLIKDVRYHYEIADILSRNGLVVFIQRPGFGPKNEEEANSFKLIKERYNGLMQSNTIINDSTIDELGKKVIEFIENKCLF
jgi:hypothetical protein